MQRHARLSFFPTVWGCVSIGLEVDEGRWKQVCAKYPSDNFAKTQIDYDYRFGTGRVVFATMPLATFQSFLVPPKDLKTSDVAWKEMDDGLTRHG